jgi:hypothetical protein
MARSSPGARLPVAVAVIESKDYFRGGEEIQR